MSVGGASIDAHHFPSQELQARHQAIIEELRCPQCLNTNLAGSDAMIARDLRREVHRLLLEGESDEEILSFMYDRYGDFVLYTPRIHSGTIFLWFGPLFFLILAIAIFISIVKSSTGANVEEVDREELAAILNPNAKELD
ncbi:MAG: cytochrome c-type biogenesis protein CcmH [Gammaproteobacteria bacterium]|uniref:Cytochrome c-type biogenesis protein n=1 Tax=OM182 bacterium TaxID=2510334 RepID=A0A520S0P7_9GAMM|nr:cytochrome c-type biogenesis protein CcmH [Gammaproteobacteria bacterium]RZO76039.1 MAG: cytochrome c-type biogenesis protein CcmH [OM182 bacterium]